MGRKSRSSLLLDKSVQAALSAIELYNKPNYQYREESFTILMVNAWELLLKAKIVEDSSNRLESIYVIDSTQRRKDGKPYKKPRYKVGRSGNKVTIGIHSAIRKLELSEPLRAQLETLVEIRDNSIHFYNESRMFDQKLLEIGTATLRSFIEMLGAWFDYPISRHHLFLIPIGFDLPEEFDLNALSSESSSHRRLLEYIAKQETSHNKPKGAHNISLNIEVQFKRNTTGIPVHQTKDSGAPIHYDSEEKFRKQYPWSFKKDLLPKLQKRYKNFSANRDFYEFKKSIESDPRYSAERYLDWNNKSGVKKRFYSPNILTEFDKRYATQDLEKAN